MLFLLVGLVSSANAFCVTTTRTTARHMRLLQERTTTTTTTTRLYLSASPPPWMNGGMLATDSPSDDYDSDDSPRTAWHAASNPQTTTTDHEESSPVKSPPWMNGVMFAASEQSSSSSPLYPLEEENDNGSPLWETNTTPPAAAEPPQTIDHNENDTSSQNLPWMNRGMFTPADYGSPLPLHDDASISPPPVWDASTAEAAVSPQTFDHAAEASSPNPPWMNERMSFTDNTSDNIPPPLWDTNTAEAAMAPQTIDPADASLHNLCRQNGAFPSPSDDMQNSSNPQWRENAGYSRSRRRSPLSLYSTNLPQQQRQQSGSYHSNTQQSFKNNPSRPFIPTTKSHPDDLALYPTGVGQTQRNWYCAPREVVTRAVDDEWPTPGQGSLTSLEEWQSRRQGSLASGPKEQQRPQHVQQFTKAFPDNMRSAFSEGSRAGQGTLTIGPWDQRHNPVSSRSTSQHIAKAPTTKSHPNDLALFTSDVGQTPPQSTKFHPEARDLYPNKMTSAVDNECPSVGQGAPAISPWDQRHNPVSSGSNSQRIKAPTTKSHPDDLALYHGGDQTGTTWHCAPREVVTRAVDDEWPTPGQGSLTSLD